MKIISRAHVALSPDDLVSSAVAAELLGVDAKTVKQSVELGTLRAYPAPHAAWTSKKWLVFRVQDVITFTVLNGYTIDRKMLASPVLGIKGYIQNYLMFGAFPEDIGSLHSLRVNLKQLINLLDVMPYTPVVVPIYANGSLYYPTIVEQLRQSYSPFQLNVWGSPLFLTKQETPLDKNGKLLSECFPTITQVEEYFVKHYIDRTETK